MSGDDGRERKEKRSPVPTIFNVAVLDLFQNFGPHSGVAFFVFFQTFGLKVDILPHAFRRGRHAECKSTNSDDNLGT